MKGMILAAGRGTRLAPLTDEIPKALVPVQGVPMLEQVARRLLDAGVDELVVNVHHLGRKVIDFLRERENFHVRLHVSDERDHLLDTGGGLAAAGEWRRGDGPFFLHNVDVLSDLDLQGMYREAVTSGALATLAVQARDTTRYLLFDREGLCGHGNAATGSEVLGREPSGPTERLGFCGIHVISPRIFDMITEQGAFSIIPLYLRLAAEGERILPWTIDDARWLDIGTHERLEQAESTW